MLDKFLSWNWHIIARVGVSIGEGVAVFLLVSHIWHSASEDFKYYIVFFGLSLLVLIFINLYLTIKINNQKTQWLSEKEQLMSTHSIEKKVLERSARYADVIPTLNRAFCTLDETLRNKETTKKDFLTAFDVYCTKLAVAFKHITGKDCGVCIKVNNNPPESEINKNNPVFSYISFDLSRDNLVEGREYKDEILHEYKKNTDFDKIFKNINTDKGKYFFSNNLLTLPLYNNTSFERYEFPYTGFPPNTSYEEKTKNWPLKYQSTIVAPICPSIADHRKKEKLLGFLCVDSNFTDIFNEAQDTELLIGCADGMWNVLYEFLQKFPKETPIKMTEA
jgi:hypothetical protein